MRVKQKRTIVAYALFALFLHAGAVQADEHEATHEAMSASSDDTKGAEQAKDEKTVKSIGSVYFVGGVSFLDFDALNGRLAKAGYSELENPTVSLGFGLSHQKGRFIFGGEGYWLKNARGESQRDDTQADIEAWYGLFRFGVVAFQYKGLSIYPLVGIGGGNIRMRISDEEGASFDEVLDDPRREVYLKQNALLLDASLGIDYRFLVKEHKTRDSYFLLGLRGGYLFAPYAKEWDMGGAEISNGPRFGITGPSAMITLGYSKQYKKHHKKHHKKKGH